MEKGTSGFFLIGCSAFGSVYVSERKSDGWTVAIKTIRTEGGAMTETPELSLLKSCTSEFIVRYFDAFISNDSLWVSNLSSVYV